VTTAALRPRWLRPVVFAAVAALHGAAFGLGGEAVVRPGAGLVAIAVVSEPDPTPETTPVPGAAPAETAAASEPASPPEEPPPPEEPLPEEPPVEDVVPDPAPAVALPAPRPAEPPAVVERKRPPRRDPAAVEQPRRRALDEARSRAAVPVERENARQAAAASYASLVAGEIRRRRYYPEEARRAGLTGTVVVAFAIGPSGGIASHSIVRSSAAWPLDAAVRGMMAGMRLPPPPGGTFRATVPVRFETQ